MKNAKKIKTVITILYALITFNFLELIIYVAYLHRLDNSFYMPFFLHAFAIGIVLVTSVVQFSCYQNAIQSNTLANKIDNIRLFSILKIVAYVFVNGWYAVFMLFAFSYPDISHLYVVYAINLFIVVALLIGILIADLTFFKRANR